jgi:hypothetical protein
LDLKIIFIEKQATKIIYTKTFYRKKEISKINVSSQFRVNKDKRNCIQNRRIENLEYEG